MGQSHVSSQKVIRVSNAVAAGTSNINCTGIDMQNWDTVEFVLLAGTLTATQVTSLKAQGSTDNSTFTDITNAATAAMPDADTNKVCRCEVVEPRKRYVRAVVVRGTANAVVDGVLAILRRSRTVPITQDASVSKTSETVGV